MQCCLDMELISAADVFNYVCKYCSKIEPGFEMDTKGMGPTEKFLKTRIMSIPEQIWLLLQFSLCEFSHEIIKCDCNLPTKR